MRIAIVMSHADRNMTGAVRDMIFARGLRAQGVDARMFRMHGGAEVEREDGLEGSVPCVFCPADNPGDIPHRQVSAALRREVGAFGPDLVLYKGLGYAVNVHLQEGLDPQPRFGLVVGGSVTDPLLSRAALVLGEYDRQLARCFPAHVKGGAAFVLPKHVDLALTAPESPAPRPRYDIVNVGGFERRKNQADLLPMTARWRVAFIGNGEMLPAARQAVPPGGKAHFLGRLPQPEVFAAMRRSRLMVHTSTMDGLPRAVVEAMACGIPVVAYRDTLYGGLQQGRHGFLVAREALGAAVDLLLKDDALRTGMGRAARAHVQRAHGPAAIEAAAAQVLEFLRR